MTTVNTVDDITDELDAHDQSEVLGRLLSLLLSRRAGPREVEMWSNRLETSTDIKIFLAQLMSWPKLSKARNVTCFMEPGHYYSPIVDPRTVREYVDVSRNVGWNSGIAGVPFPLEEMEAFWARNREVIASTPFPDEAHPDFRYSFLGGPYNYGDGVTLRAMINDRRPKRIIEIGSGYSTACMLDTADELGLGDLRITCIEPNPTRLKSILRQGDLERVTIIQGGVQGLPLAQFAELEANDILFIDSTHVLKTGSDVHYELFYILPVLQPGVIVHFHDCRYPLEYSDIAIFQKNWSWNEVYAVRALLMYSTRFRVIFSGSYFADHRNTLIRETFPPFLINPGSALWLRVAADGSPSGLAVHGGLTGFEMPLPARAR